MHRSVSVFTGGYDHQHAIAMNPTDGYFYLNRGLVYARLGEYDVYYDILNE